MFSWLKAITGILLPCPCCGKGSGSRGNALCPECLKLLSVIPDDAELCPGCGGIMTGALACCDQCLAEPERPWKRAFTVMPYRGTAGKLIRRLKFYNSPELARPLGYLLAEKIRQHRIEADLIVPIPLYFNRWLSRRYNQSLLLAEIAGRECGIPVREVLKRRQRRSRQLGRSRLDRHKELAGTMILKYPEAVSGKHILLLDDVMTTGATLHTAAVELLKAKPASITVLTLARTPSHAGF